jgi:zinc transport system substrate-binding protein
LLLVAAVVAAGCGASAGGSTSGPKTPPVEVVTGLYPLAQAVAAIGTNEVVVTDVVPSGVDPLTYQLTPAETATVHQAALAVVVGDGFQASMETAASGARAEVALRQVVRTTDPYVWLDPPVMHQAVDAIAAALARVDPAEAGHFREGATAFADEVDSTGIDYESTLSACPRQVIVTADGAFSAMAATYGLTDHVVGTASHPSAGAVSAAASAATAGSVTTAFEEPFAGSGTVEAVARAAHLKVRTLDPLAGPPPGGWPHSANYITLLESDLGTLNNALGCPDTSTGDS